MATTTDLIVSKLILRYSNPDSIPPTIQKETFADLWSSYCAEFNGGSVDADGLVATPGLYWAGQALYDHYGGPEINFGDRANRFWNAWVPAVGG